jgi:hypothetical protein
VSRALRIHQLMWRCGARRLKLGERWGSEKEWGRTFDLRPARPGHVLLVEPKPRQCRACVIRSSYS